jgi:hypothetical protein
MANNDIYCFERFIDDHQKCSGKQSYLQKPEIQYQFINLLNQHTELGRIHAMVYKNSS